MRSVMSSIKSPTGIHPHSNPIGGSGATPSSSPSTSSSSSIHKSSSKLLHSGTALTNHGTTPLTPTITTSNHGHSLGTHSVGGHSLGSNPQPSPKLYHTTASAAVPSQASSSRRIWIKRVGGTPTTFTVTKSDIIDDLKTLVLHKFANSLGRSFDSADLILKMDLLSRVPTNITSSNAKKSSTIGSASSGKLSPEPPRSRASSTLSNHPNRSTNAVNNTNANANNYSLINLEPDQNVWAILEQYYPHGMGMTECLIVDVQDQPMMMYQTLPVDYSLQQRQPQYGNYHQPQLQHPQQQQQGLQSQPIGQEHQTPSNLAKPPVFSGDHSNSTANLSSSNTPLYYQPKPQNLYLNKSLASGSQGNSSIIDSMAKDRSISPSALNGTSPLGQHRRAHSNPPQSPLHYSGSQHNSNNNNNNNSNNNNNNSGNSNPNQAILLLPKNFSLSTGNSSASQDGNNYSDKKRMSFDDGYLRRNRNSTLKPSHLGTNITNIGMGITSPTSNLVSYVSIPENDNFKSPEELEFNKKLKDTEGSRKDAKSPQPINSSLRKEQTDSDKDTVTSKLGNTEEEQKKLSLTQLTKENLSNESLQSKNREKTLSTKPGTSSTSKPNSLLNIQVADSKRNQHGNNNNTSNSNQFNMKQQSKSTTERVLPSISVLVVEDNAINQAILRAFLRKHKIHYQIAKNGQEAVDKWRQGGFHLVLMDIQLPVKSGIEATKEIRYLEKINRIGVFAENELINSHYSSNPELKREEYLDLNVFRSPVIIVALTASSNSSTDKKKALMAGCNDYLTKPVNLVWLQNKITEWGCMQALIDFDGWDRKRVSNVEKRAPKAPTPRTEKGVLLEGPVQITTN